MRCLTCDYPLWNLTARECPECGRPFRPSEQEFVPNAVRFCCPDCNQDYYGVGKNGLLEPRAFDCVKCGRALDMDEMVLRPAAGVEEEQTRVDTHPWINREGRSWFKSWLRTVGLSMVGPLRLMRGLPVDAMSGQAWWFAILTVLMILTTGAAVPFLGIAVISMFAGGDPIEQVIAAVGFLVVGTVFFVITVAVWGVVTHGLLLMTGGAPYPISRTYQALCYSAGANITSALPCLGLYPFGVIGLGWWLVSAVMMVGEAQNIRGARAALATLVFPAIVVVLATAGMFTAVFFGMTQARIAMAQQAANKTEAECVLVLDALTDFSATAGRWPVHALDLVDDSSLTPLDFIVLGSMTHEASVPIGDTDMQTLFELEPVERRRLVAEVIDALPDDVFAHRLGDFVCTWHGVDPDGEEPTIWLLIVSPDPDLNPALDVDGMFTVGMRDGTVLSFPASEMGVRLDEQNGLRGAEGLPALPLPETVRHGAPATAEVP